MKTLYSLSVRSFRNYLNKLGGLTVDGKPSKNFGNYLYKKDEVKFMELYKIWQIDKLNKQDENIKRGKK